MPEEIFDPLPTPPSAPTPPKPAISERRLIANRRNAQTAGITKGKQFAHKAVYVKAQEQAVEAIATAVLETGKCPVRLSPKLGPVTEDDRKQISRTLGMPVEDFQARIMAKLEVLAEKVGKRMEEKLDANEYKPSDLNMALAITLDKHAAVSGRNALKGASVNIQVNNFGDSSNKEDLIKEIRGALNVTPV